jgi:hypothetical protein
MNVNVTKIAGQICILLIELLEAKAKRALTINFND